mgnify:CR=1 FL=1
MTRPTLCERLAREIDALGRLFRWRAAFVRASYGGRLRLVDGRPWLADPTPADGVLLRVNAAELIAILRAEAQPPTEAK